MALTLSFLRETNQVLFAGNSCVKEVILNRPQKLNSLNHEMINQMKKRLTLYENDPSIKLIILKANGKAFCAGGDVISVITSSIAGHWTYPRKLLQETTYIGPFDSNLQKASGVSH
ncbi:hypothetical protein QN277_000244 [Acacia crassicarpa]|uniref:3-hydroxyisobutyryl-CoA hydrolase n=1 Tax=Acacia crassicarpa TaxID=499986 RepID=A0AAE1N762_9FABA|nr:hypothetical protein QN277_000244 [Acacia crassicarpa]